MEADERTWYRVVLVYAEGGEKVEVPRARYTDSGRAARAADRMERGRMARGATGYRYETEEV